MFTETFLIKIQGVPLATEPGISLIILIITIIITIMRTTDTHYRHTLQTRTTDTHYRHNPFHFSHNEPTAVQTHWC